MGSDSWLFCMPETSSPFGFCHLQTWEMRPEQMRHLPFCASWPWSSYYHHGERHRHTGPIKRTERGQAVKGEKCSHTHTHTHKKKK